jgi:hypothetical protein
MRAVEEATEEQVYLLCAIYKKMFISKIPQVLKNQEISELHFSLRISGVRLKNIPSVTDFSL